MEHRQDARLAGEKRQTRSDASTWSPADAPIYPAAMRPLSDIRELTEPSLIDAMVRRSTSAHRRQPDVSRQSSLKRGDSIKRRNTVRIIEPSESPKDHRIPELEQSLDTSPESFREASSVYSIPSSSVPRRASSQTRKDHKRDVSPSKRRGRAVPDRGHSDSPVKQAAIRLAAVASESSRAIPPTLYRTTPQTDILTNPTYRHSRVTADLQVTAPLFVGGGSVEGCVRIMVDDADWHRPRRNLTISRVSVDLMGVEQSQSPHKTAPFLSIATELVNVNHPPPRKMVESVDPISCPEPSWTLRPCYCTLPFSINLPLDPGPAPFQSRTATIRYLLCTTLAVKESGRAWYVRSSQEIAVLPTYDPERALRSLPSPLTVSDEYHLTSKKGAIEVVRLTVGIHRHVWVSGTTIFADVYIANNTHKTIERLELSLEQNILTYRHAAAATLEMSASQARIFENKEQILLSKSTLKNGVKGWTGVKPRESALRTCDLDLPKGHASIECKKYFEVRFFLNVTVWVSRTKAVTVQLPVRLIHMNSLDVVPNAVAQVAEAIEEKRHRHHRRRSQKSLDEKGRMQYGRQPPVTGPEGVHRLASQIQGRAFAAPRQQSLDRIRDRAADMEHLSHVLESSPRKQQKSKDSHRHIGKKSAEGGRYRPPAREPVLLTAPAREVHKTPSNLSLGGISVGSYTVFSNGIEYHTPPNSHRKGRLFNSNVLGQNISDEFDAVGRRLRTMRSLESLHSQRSMTTLTGKLKGSANRSKSRTRFDDAGPGADKAPGTILGQHDLGPSSLGPHALGLQTLGLSSHVHAFQPNDRDEDGANPLRGYKGGEDGNSLGRRASRRSREGVDRSRFEFDAVRRKGSGGLKGWWDHKRAKSRDRQMEKAREDWI